LQNLRRLKQIIILGQRLRKALYVSGNIMRYTTIILSLLLTVTTLAQKSKKEPIHFQVSCGFAAYTDKEIIEFKKGILLNDSVRIRKKLISGSEMEQVLSAIVLKYYLRKDDIHLSSAELDKIDQISHSKRQFELCHTCTYQDKGTLQDLFNDKRGMPSYKIIEQFLLR
jgi:hypothetical protein